MKFSNLNGLSVWITGASSGIGLQMALIAARAGASLLLISSRKEALMDAAKQCRKEGAPEVNIAVANFSEPHDVTAMTLKILEHKSPPDYLILNAGVSQRSLAGETDLDVTQYIMDINFTSAVAIARILVPAMVNVGGASIGVTSSLVGEFGFPQRSSYSASKHALHGYFESVALEYRHEGIWVTLVLPGRIRTPISMNAFDGQGRRHLSMDPGQQNGMDPAICAERYWKALIKGRRYVLIGGTDRIMVYLHRFLPGLFRRIARRISVL